MSTQTNLLRITIPIFVTLLLVFGVSGVVVAADFRTGSTVTVAKGELIDDDLVLSGQTIVVDGTVNGDLVAMGGDVTINGVIKGSLLVGARSLLVNGTVGGSLYNGGATITLGPQAVIERNLFFGGYSLNAERGSLIQRDLMTGGYQALLNGDVQRDLRAGLSALQLNSKVGGDVYAEVASPQEPPLPPFFLTFAGQNLPAAVAPGLHIGSDAQIGGKLNYSSPVEQGSAILAAPNGGVAFTPAPVTTAPTVFATPRSTQDLVLTWIWERLRQLISLLVLGALALWLIPKWFDRAADNVWHEPIASTGWGFVVTVVGYILAGLALVLLIVITAGLGRLTLAGLASSFFFSGLTGIGTLFTLFTLLLAYGSKLVVVYPLGHWMMSQFSAVQAEKRSWALVLGVLLYVLVRSIPYLGFVVGLFVTMIGIGAMWLIFRNRPKAAAVPPKMVLQPM